MLASGGEAAAGRGAQFVIARDALVLLGQELHGEAHAGHFRAGDRELARVFRPARQHHRVEVLLQGLERNVDADLLRGFEGHPFRFHLLGAAVDEMLFHLEVGDAIAEQTADAVRLLEHRHRVPGARQLLRAGQARRTRADDGDLLAGLLLGHLRRDPPFLPPAVDNRAFDRLDGHRLVDDVQGARRLAGRGADAAGEFGEVVGRMEVRQRPLPVRLVDEVVPVRDHVVHRTAVVAVGDAAIHAARGLPRERRIVRLNDELAVVLQALLGIEIVPLAAVQLEKSGFLAHTYISFLKSIRQRRWRLRGARPRAASAQQRNRAASP